MWFVKIYEIFSTHCVSAITQFYLDFIMLLLIKYTTSGAA